MPEKSLKKAIAKKPAKKPVKKSQRKRPAGAKNASPKAGLKKHPEVAVIMGSLSDLKSMNPAIKLLQKCRVGVEVKVVSAHRTPDFMRQYAKKAAGRGIQLIIAGAGGAAHLPGMTACFTSLPVIGVPIALKHLKGLDSLLSTVQMPKGVPVATVAVDNSFNAALLALRILALKSPMLTKKLRQFQEEQKAQSLKANPVKDFLMD